MRSTLIVLLLIFLPPILGVIIAIIIGNAIFAIFVWILTVAILVYILMKYTYKTKSGAGFLGNEEKYLTVIFKLSIKLMAVDGEISDKEITWVKQSLKDSFKDKYAEKHITEFVALLTVEENLFTICKTINRNFGPAERVQMINFLIKLSAIDGKISDEEFVLLETIAKYLHVHKKILISILAMLGYQPNEKEQKRRYQRNAVPSKIGLKNSYQILGVNENTSDLKVKKAFRKLANIHHPDKISHLGEKFQESASIKFQKILEAYERVKVSRGM
ncbi:hypothetical protein DNU06_13455 [Putridiphycobacter roseus]|uniref:J domain-containing protein n=1 Tax=Putridiphycobacter roseus TaxID=2219161 RepID=A0A2W1MY60_9FLAO|nr:TerB family tellurite resistance protein [Putridiphycobacter roseus]PZE16314.1 hypothetical protein DNU06_13455 [Putridiphycobacter roseus]